MHSPIGRGISSTLLAHRLGHTNDLMAGPREWPTDRPSVGSEESTPGSRSFEIAICPALLDLVSALSLPPAILLRFTDRQRNELSAH